MGELKCSSSISKTKFAEPNRSWTIWFIYVKIADMTHTNSVGVGVLDHTQRKLGEMAKHICGEITYETDIGPIHSDICIPDMDDVDRVEDCGDTHRKFLHRVLDEWLDKSNGTGFFHVGNERE